MNAFIYTKALKPDARSDARKKTDLAAAPAKPQSWAVFNENDEVFLEHFPSREEAEQFVAEFMDEYRREVEGWPNEEQLSAEEIVLSVVPI